MYMWINPQHNVIVVRSGMVVDLVLLGKHSLLKLSLGGLVHSSNSLFIQSRNHLTIAVLFQITHRKVVSVFLQPVTEVYYSPVRFLLGPLPGFIVSIYGCLKAGSCPGCQVETGLVKLVQYTGRVKHGSLILQGIFHHRSFCFPCCEDKGHCVRIMGDGIQSDGNYQPVPGYLDTPQVTCSDCLCFKICFCETGSGMVI